MAKILSITFKGSLGTDLSARLHLPNGPAQAYAIFAHCFTCSKDIHAARKIADQLAKRGIALFRFDFTGLGASSGNFEDTSFTSNISDILAAVDYLRSHYQAPSVLIGHSLGGAAILAAAIQVPEAKAVATIGAPSDAEHVIHNFSSHLDEIEERGIAELELAGRPFKIKRDFVEDLRNHTLRDAVAKLNKALMILHSPTDATVGIENAAEIYEAARHPKSFVSLDTADHLLSNADDVSYVADVITAWASRYIDAKDDAVEQIIPESTIVGETNEGKFQNHVRMGRHSLFVDEPVSVGGHDTGPTPYDLISASLGACTSMTIRMYADFKKIPLRNVSVSVSHDKVHADDCADCEQDKGSKIDHFRREITLQGELDAETRAKLLSIADKCPVHKTLESKTRIITDLVM